VAKKSLIYSLFYFIYDICGGKRVGWKVIWGGWVGWKRQNTFIWAMGGRV